jgi:hypothetical protein
MNRYCNHCGAVLRPVGDFASLWFTIFECSSGSEFHDFMEVGDPRLVFPLLDLSLDVKRRLLESDSELVKLAASRIKMINYKTVSIVAFEQTISGSYREADHV